MKENDVIYFDFQGWPVYRLTLEDIIKNSGLFTYDPDKKVYYIKADDPRLGIYPTTLEDDGMGYGVNEKFVTECSYVPVENSKDRINVFIHPKKENTDPVNF